MKWLVLNTLGDDLLPFGYNSSIRIAYALGITVVSANIGVGVYTLEEDSKTFTFEAKMQLLLNMTYNTPDYESYEKAVDDLKNYKKIKNKK